MNRIPKDWKKIFCNLTCSIILKVNFFFSLIKNIFNTVTPVRIVVAIGPSLATATSVFAYVSSREQFTTNPVELLGSFAYYANLNITNRLNAVAIFFLISLVVFTAFLFFFFAMKEHENDALIIVGFSLLPGMYWLASIILKPQATFSLFWLDLSVCLCWLAFFSFLRGRGKGEKVESTGILLVAFSLSFFVAPAILVFIKSPLFFKLPYFPQPQDAYRAMQVLNVWLAKLMWVPPLFVFLVWLFFPRRNVLMRCCVYPVQICLLLFFCLILPSFFLIDGVLTVFFRSGMAFYIIVLPLILVGVWDCTKRCFFDDKGTLSPFPFLALLIFFFLRSGSIPGFNYSNTFEIGARFPAFWASFEEGSSLFKDKYITYGLWDYAQYLFGWFFSGQHTAAVSTYGNHLFSALILALEFLTLSSIVPVGLAFLLCLIAGIGAGSVVLIYFTILLHPRLIDRPGVWIIVWVVISSIVPFARIPQGTLCVVASLPAFLWQALKLFRQNRRYFWKIVGFLCSAGFMMSIWPFGQYFWGLLRIFSDTARVNSAWSANVWKIDTLPLFEVLIGNAVFIIPIGSLVLAIIILRHGFPQFKNFVAFFLFSFVVLYVFISISYGFSRMDWWPYGRQFQVFLAILVPLLTGVIAFVRSKKVQALCICILLIFAGIWPVSIISPNNFMETAHDFPVLAESEIQDASAYGLTSLGVGRFSVDYLLEEQVLKKSLDQVLLPDETYLNLTVEGMHYITTQRKLVTEYPNYFVYPGEAPQFRAIEELRKNHVQVTLLEPTYADESPSPLRTYYLYRYALLNGLPWEITPTKTLLLPLEYFSKIGLTSPSPTQTLQMLDKQFPMTNFSYLPSVWGHGYQKFAGNLGLVRNLTTMHGQVTDGITSIEYKLQPPLQSTNHHVDHKLAFLGYPRLAKYEIKLIE